MIRFHRLKAGAYGHAGWEDTSSGVVIQARDPGAAAAMIPAALAREPDMRIGATHVRLYNGFDLIMEIQLGLAEIAAAA